MDIERIVWVAYYTKKRKFSSKSGWTGNFNDARIYNKYRYLVSSLGKVMIQNEQVIPVPVKIILEDTTLISLKLGCQSSDISI